MKLSFSFIIPVYNRPDEIQELLETFAQLDWKEPYEIVIIEDGSTRSSEGVIRDFEDRLSISYYMKENTGPGPSRNYGMQKAEGNYYLILDSDCLLPPDYLKEVQKELETAYVDFFGGPDAAMDSFSDIQKALNYTMTAVLTTGGIRGGVENLDKFQPRSFNMGLSKNAFLASEGFGKIHPGEDPDLVLRLWKMAYKSRLFPNVFVYHKRRISWSKFYTQVHKFGLVRPILNSWHKGSGKVTYWFPTVFVLGFVCSLLFLSVNSKLLLLLYVAYFAGILVHASFATKSLKVGLLSLWSVCIQFFGYGYGFLKSSFFVRWLKRNPKEQFPKLFFD